MKIITGDSLEILKKATPNSVDAIVTDPPYGLSFMGKKWDYDVPSVEIWKECYRVLKPGGYLLAFAGTRTQHRMAVNIEDAGFEIRDMIAWVYGSGFPKSLNIGKAIDKKPNIHLASQMRDRLNEYRIKAGLTTKQINEHFGFATTGSGVAHHWLTHPTQPTVPTKDQYQELKKLLNIEDESLDDLYVETERELLALDKNWGQKGDVPISGYGEFKVTKGVTEWEGWGTALKPALEPITVARKPLSEKTVAENVLKWGTGGINIDGSRVGTEKVVTSNGDGFGTAGIYGTGINDNKGDERQGRFPANLIHDGSDEVVSLFPDTTKQGSIKKQITHGKIFGEADRFQTDETYYGDSGSAARFFYCAKASKKDRDEGLNVQKQINPRPIGEAFGNGNAITDQSKSKGNNHPTVKPTKLMQYLVKLVTPKGGVVLDPFMGSGSTGKACKLEGFDFIGIEREPEYVEIAKARIGL